MPTQKIAMSIKPLNWQRNSSLDMSFNTSESNDSTSTEPSTFRFPKITLPPRNHRITTVAELVTYLNKRPSELRDTFKTTYDITSNLEASNSLLEFLDKWGNCKNPMCHYLQVEFSNEFIVKLFTILNIQANLMGCVFLASLYPCFREGYLKDFDTEISEERITRDFVHMIRYGYSLRRRCLLSYADGNYLEQVEAGFVSGCEPCGPTCFCHRCLS